MLGVVAAAVGYPEKCETGAVLQGLTELSPDVHLFHAGTCRDEEGRFLTAGGRAFLLGAKGRTIPEARERVYRELDKVQCPGIFYRRDIGLRAYQTMQEASQGASL
jgi:phosphoribosylamine--glycine ligase